MFRFVMLAAAAACIAVFAGAAWGLADARAAASSAPRDIDPARWAAASERLIREGKNALAAGDFVTARDQFSNLLDVEPNNVTALHGIALGHFALGEKAKGVLAIEKALALLEKQGKEPDRALLLNLSMAQIADRRPMRAARYLMDYLKEHSEPIDEAVLNALGSAREAADAQAQRGTFYKQVDKVYRELNAKLEKTRKDGWRRWGVRWVAPGEYASLERQLNRLLDQEDKARAAARDAAAAARRLKELQGRVLIGTATRAQVSSAQTDLANRQSAFDAALNTYRTLRAGTKLPEYPETLAAVPIDELAPPRQAVAVASAQQTAALRQSRRNPTPGATAKPPVAPPAPRDNDPLAENKPPPTLIVPRQPGKRTLTRMAAAFPIAPGLFATSADAVAGAKEITLSDLAGNSYPAIVVRSDPKVGLALLRAEQAAGKLHPVRLADSFKSGPVQCVNFAAASIFDLKTELITGNLRIAGAAASLSLPREPRRTGAPLVADGLIVGVTLNDRGADLKDLPVATLEQLRAFLASDLPAAPAAGHPADVTCEVQATVVVE